MPHTIAKSEMTAHFEDLCREMERTGRELIVTDQGNPVLKLVPYSQKTGTILERLRGSGAIRRPNGAVVGEDREA